VAFVVCLMEGREPVLHITKECLDLGLRAEAIVFRHVTVGASPAGLRERMRSAALDLQRRFVDIAALRGSTELRAFAGSYRLAGVNPKRQQPGCERLAEFVWKRGELPAINSLVDAYNMVSVTRLLSLGAHDLQAVTPPIRLAIVPCDMTFTPLGTSERISLRPGEFAYLDDGGRVICRLDVIQAEFSKVTAASTDVVVIVEGTSSHDGAALLAARTELVELIGEFCGGSAA
jgi:DNA/RNA-binding domain of Phe-tRNA-synthetase-like protein